MFKVQVINHKEHSISTNSTKFNSFEDADKKALECAKLHLSIYKHKQIGARLTKMDTGYKVRHWEIRITEI